jgi:adenylosuccinate synthase
MATVVIGAQWGDEGKGKLVDILCDTVDVCARCQGGNNAGHTIVADGIEYDFHMLPSGLINSKCLNVIGSGVVVHVPSFFKELDGLGKKGLITQERIFISDRAHIVFDLHQMVDGLEEVQLGAQSIGTTRKGIGPCYSTKASRSGVRMAEVFDEELFEKKLRKLAQSYKRQFGSLLEYDVESEIMRFRVGLFNPLWRSSIANPTPQTYREKLAPYVIDIIPFMTSVHASNKRILVEGANAIMLDLDYGTYPYVTSSNTGIGGVFTGLGLSPFAIETIIGVVKAYTTRVGSGPMPSEQLNVCVHEFMPYSRVSHR